jgi:hypothetical protein
MGSAIDKSFSLVVGAAKTYRIFDVSVRYTGCCPVTISLANILLVDKNKEDISAGSMTFAVKRRPWLVTSKELENPDSKEIILNIPLVSSYDTGNDVIRSLIFTLSDRREEMASGE